MNLHLSHVIMYLKISLLPSDFKRHSFISLLGALVTSHICSNPDSVDPLPRRTIHEGKIFKVSSANFKDMATIVKIVVDLEMLPIETSPPFMLKFIW